MYIWMPRVCIFCDSYKCVLLREKERERGEGEIEIEKDIYVCTAHCSLLELTKCVIEPSTPRVTCNSETIACHCLPGTMYLHV